MIVNFAKMLPQEYKPPLDCHIVVTTFEVNLWTVLQSPLILITHNTSEGAWGKTHRYSGKGVPAKKS